jgi:glucokinase
MEYAIAIDMGGTNIRGVIIDSKLKIHKSLHAHTEPEKGKKKVIDNLVKMINDLKASTDKKIKGVGVSMPGFINKKGRVDLGGYTLKILDGTNIKNILEKRTKCKILIENDANCFAFAEAIYGAGKGYDYVVGVIWGSGIGGGIIIDQKIYRGALGGAGEFGEMIIEPDSKLKTLEDRSCGKGIMKRYKQRGGKIPNAGVYEIFHSKEKVAKEIIADAVRHFGLGLANLIHIINPEVLVIGGGVSKLPLKVYKTIRSEILRHTHPALVNHVKIVRHAISDDAGLLGAAALVFEA